MKPRFAIPIIIVLAIIAGFFIYPVLLDRVGITAPDFFVKDFKFGLDIRGGTHLVYRADVSDIPSGEKNQAMEGLKDVIERRVNLFGVSEPVITVSKVGGDQRLIVELAGVTDVNEAINLIGATPYLEFRKPEIPEIQLDSSGEVELSTEQQISFVPTQLTGRFLEKAVLSFDNQTNEPIVSLEFNNEGADMFAELTKQYIGQQIAIYLDGMLLSAPVVQQEITGGQAQITGRFTIQEAKELVQSLNAGALPVPIELISQQTIGATLGEESLQKSLVAGAVGFLLVALFMIFYYRMAGIIAVIALAIYIIILLTIFKLIPVTLTLAGIVGFILSVGMAVDANILIFERMKEELRSGQTFRVAVEEGFSRAWTAIKDAYTSTLMTAVVLYWFGTSLVRGFAFTLALGLLISLFSAIVLTKTFLRAFAGTRLRDIKVLWRQ
jgi:protein-export membrane protein SecD